MDRLFPWLPPPQPPGPANSRVVAALLSPPGLVESTSAELSLETTHFADLQIGIGPKVGFVYEDVPGGTTVSWTRLSPEYPGFGRPRKPKLRRWAAADHGAAR